MKQNEPDLMGELTEWYRCKKAETCHQERVRDRLPGRLATQWEAILKRINPRRGEAFIGIYKSPLADNMTSPNFPC